MNLAFICVAVNESGAVFGLSPKAEILFKFVVNFVSAILSSYIRPQIFLIAYGPSAFIPSANFCNAFMLKVTVSIETTPVIANTPLIDSPQNPQLT